MKTTFWLIGFMWLAGWCFGAGIREGMSRPEVEAELGAPISSMVMGETTILHYPDRGRVELVAGKVTRVVRVRHQDDPATPEEIAAEAAIKAEAESRLEQEAEAAKEAKELAAAEAEWARANAEAQQGMEQAVEQMTTAHENGDTEGGMAMDLGLVARPSHFWIGLGVALFVQVGVGMVVLKLAFAWTDLHADWGQMFLPALAAAVSGAVVRAAGYALWQTDQLFRIDDVIAFAVLLFTLMKTTHACTWARAAGVAMAAQLMSIVVWVFLSVALMQLLFA